MIRGVSGLAAYQEMARAQSAAAAAVRPAAPDGIAPADFTSTLGRAVGAVETQHKRADSALELLASGKHVDLHGTMIELEKADIALRTMVSVRDKFIAAYEAVMNMSV